MYSILLWSILAMSFFPLLAIFCMWSSRSSSFSPSLEYSRPS